MVSTMDQTLIDSYFNPALVIGRILLAVVFSSMMIIESALLKIDIYILGVNNRVLLVDGCCQCNANQSPKFASQQVLGSDQLAPFEKGGVS